MANSMIPYSFIPGTKAKANEVNANFIALAEQIQQNKNSASQDIDDFREEISDVINAKADKTDLITEFTVDEFDTDLDDYKTKGTYIFTSDYTPLNIPIGESGMLIVTGDVESSVKQVWFSDDNKMYSRTYKNSEWNDWQTPNGDLKLESPGYLQMPNGLLIQWGASQGSIVTYPIAYKQFASPVFTKIGYGSNYARSDTGFIYANLTGFSMGSDGLFGGLNYIVVGY